jgi:hypothetical protein
MTDCVECPIDYLQELAADCVAASHQSSDIDATEKMLEVASKLLELTNPGINTRAILDRTSLLD